LSMRVNLVLVVWGAVRCVCVWREESPLGGGRGEHGDGRWEAVAAALVPRKVWGASGGGGQL
jgi:hypothetical protein